jgi:hypothetical protein
MLLHISTNTSIPYSSVMVMTYKPEEGVTAFKLRDGTWVTSKGDWRKSVETGLKYRAISVKLQTFELRA